MREVIDSPEYLPEPEFIRKSAFVFKIYAVVIVVLILLGWITLNGPLENNPASGWLNFLLIILLLALVTAPPVGLVFVLKAYGRKEATPGLRLIHLIGHAIFGLIMFAIGYTLVMDVSRLFMSI